MRPAIALIFAAACTSSSAAQPKPAGFVALASLDMQNPPLQEGDALARFYKTKDPEMVVSSQGACETAKDVLTSDDEVDAGLITISGTRPDISLSPDPTNDYKPYQQSTPLYSGGEALTISAGGGEVPAFAGHLTAPGKVIVTAPAPPPQFADLYLPRGQDFVLTWTSGTAGLVQVLLTAPSTHDVVTCRFPAADGTGTVPRDVLAAVDTGVTVGIDVEAVDAFETNVAEWNVEVSAEFAAMYPNNTRASSYVTFQ